MAFWIPLAIGAGAGLLKHYAVDKPQQKKTAQLRAEEMRMSPFTGQAPQTQIQWANPMGSALQGGVTGASMWQGMADAEMKKKLAETALNNGASNALLAASGDPLMTSLNMRGPSFGGPVG